MNKCIGSVCQPSLLPTVCLPAYQSVCLPAATLSTFLPPNPTACLPLCLPSCCIIASCLPASLPLAGLPLCLPSCYLQHILYSYLLVCLSGSLSEYVCLYMFVPACFCLPSSLPLACLLIYCTCLHCLPANLAAYQPVCLSHLLTAPASRRRRRACHWMSCWTGKPGTAQEKHSTL